MDITEEQIRERAYQIWEREGEPHGRNLEHWLQAHWELMNEAAAKDGATKEAPCAPAATEEKPKPARRTAKAKAAPEEAAPAAAPAKAKTASKAAAKPKSTAKKS